MFGEGEQTVSESWRKSVDLDSTSDPNTTSTMAADDEHICKLILYKEIQDSRVRIWDVAILIPNLLFLLFILIRFNRARLKLRATSSPIFLAFYGLVICNVVISVVRCAVSMTVNAAADVGEKVDKVLWVTVRFFLLATEMSVVIFGLAFGHLDSRSSIRRVLFATSLISLAFTITQGTLELVLPDDTFRIPSRDFYVFGHGGMMFWFCSSIVFTLIYLFILILPWTRLRDRLNLPTRKSFYFYAGTLAMLNLVQSVGAGLLNYTQNPVGLCVVDLTAAIYLTLFTPLVYHTFLSEFFGVSQPSIMFSYKAQVDDAMEEDTVSLPHQQSFSSLKTDSDYIYQVHTPSIHMPLYESLATKPSVSKQRNSLYSLSSKMDTKITPSTSRYSSQSTLNAPINDKNYLQKTTTTTQLSSPELSVDNNSTTDSIGNLMISPSTASNFIYSPNDNDSNANLFSQSRKQSIDNNYDDVDSSQSDTQKINNDVLKSLSSSSSLIVNSPSASMIPPLENSLKNILDSEDDTVSTSSMLTKNLSPNQSVKSFDSDATSDNTRQSPDKNISQRSNYDLKKKINRDEREESGGLGDYLQSLKSPKYQSPVEKKRDS